MSRVEDEKWRKVRWRGQGMGKVADTFNFSVNLGTEAGSDR